MIKSPPRPGAPCTTAETFRTPLRSLCLLFHKLLNQIKTNRTISRRFSLWSRDWVLLTTHRKKGDRACGRPERVSSFFSICQDVISASLTVEYIRSRRRGLAAFKFSERQRLMMGRKYIYHTVYVSRFNSARPGRDRWPTIRMLTSYCL